MTFADALNRVLRYAMATDEEVRPFLQQHQLGDESAVPVMADWLRDRDDPRATIVGRHLGQEQHPKGLTPNDYVDGFPATDYDGQPAALELSTGSTGIDSGQNSLTFSPFRKGGFWTALSRKKPTDVMVTWTHSHSPVRNGIPSFVKTDHSHFEAVLTPEEVRAMAAHLPESATGVLHEFMDRHFGKGG